MHAQEFFDKVFKLNNDYSGINNKNIQALNKLKKAYQDYLNKLESLIKINADTSVIFKRGASFKLLKNFQGNEKFFRESLSLSLNDVIIYNNKKFESLWKTGVCERYAPPAVSSTMKYLNKEKAILISEKDLDTYKTQLEEFKATFFNVIKPEKKENTEKVFISNKDKFSFAELKEKAKTMTVVYTVYRDTRFTSTVIPEKNVKKVSDLRTYIKTPCSNLNNAIKYALNKEENFSSYLFVNVAFKDFKKIKRWPKNIINDIDFVKMIMKKYIKEYATEYSYSCTRVRDPLNIFDSYKELKRLGLKNDQLDKLYKLYKNENNNDVKVDGSIFKSICARYNLSDELNKYLKQTTTRYDYTELWPEICAFKSVYNMYDDTTKRFFVNCLNSLREILI